MTEIRLDLIIFENLLNSHFKWNAAGTKTGLMTIKINHNQQFPFGHTLKYQI